MSGSRQIGLERLESRQFLSASPSAAITKAEVIVPAVKAAVLGPSAVEGRYKGDVTEKDGTVIEVKFVVTSTRAELIIADGATLVAKLTSVHFLAIRKGTFDVKFISGSHYVSVVGTVGKSGLKIAGTYTSNVDAASGSFALKKYSDAT